MANAFLSLADIGRRMAPDGAIADMAELLSQCNEIIDDIPYVVANQPTSHVTTLRTQLPIGTYRRFNQGVNFTKSGAAQVTFGMAQLEAWSQIDKYMAGIGGDVAGQREKEDVAHMEGLSQQQATTSLYGNAFTSPAQFTGMSPYYASVSTATAQDAVNVFDCGGTGSSNTSMWLMGWSDRTCYGIYPPGSVAGLQFDNLGESWPAFDSSSRPYLAYTSHFRWVMGLAVEDWRWSVRMANIDTTTAGLAGPTPPDLYAILSKAVVRLPTAGRMVSGITKTDAPDRMGTMPNLRIYCDRTVRQYLDIQAIRDRNVLLSPTDYAGRPIVNFRNVPIGVVDALLNTEARVV